tara:strand:+ start:331 stop:552 length:222 start_codon:yes stop_codon:yes gene_type:complete
MIDAVGKFTHKHEHYTGYSVGRFILDLRTDILEVEVFYHQEYKKSFKREIIKFNGGGEVDIELILDKIYNQHY